MPDLISYAEKLATDPPIEVYKKLMKLFSAAQLSTLTKPVASNERAVKFYNKAKAEYEQLATKYEQMVGDYKAQGVGVARFSITAICDFVAMCMMMIAVGSQRVEDLKSQLRGQQGSGPFQTKAGDRAYILHENSRAQDFTKIMKDWCTQKKSGIVQFKFPAGDDLHTFAVERALGQSNQPEFIVYQGYQNTYSLSHFLRIQSVWKDDALDALHQGLWEEEVQNGTAKYKAYKGDDGYWAKVWLPQLENAERASKCIGGKQRLGVDDLNQYVIQPLAIMLSGQLENARYINLTGSPTTSNISSAYMILLMCDAVDSSEFAANCQELYKVPGGLTKYAEWSA